MKPTDEQIVAQAKFEGEQTGVEAFSDLARSHTGVNSAYGIGFIDGAVWCRDECKCDKIHLEDVGVKEIARMQKYIDDLENYLWRMAMTIEGRDNGEMIVRFTEEGSPSQHATNVIYDFIKEHKDGKEESK